MIFGNLNSEMCVQKFCPELPLFFFLKIVFFTCSPSRDYIDPNISFKFLAQGHNIVVILAKRSSTLNQIRIRIPPTPNQSRLSFRSAPVIFYLKNLLLIMVYIYSCKPFYFKVFLRNIFIYLLKS